MRKLIKLHKYRAAPIAVLALVLIVFGGWGFWRRYQVTHTENPSIPLETTLHSVSDPDETPLRGSCDGYGLGSDQPRQVVLPNSIAGCIQKVGIDQHNAIAVPTNIHLGGWYVGSVLPGELGVSVIDGHVRGRYKDGIFVTLPTTQPGQVLRIEMGDGSWREFEIVSVDRYSVEQANTELFVQLEGVERQLVLVTCDGQFDSETESYRERVLVRAKLHN